MNEEQRLVQALGFRDARSNFGTKGDVNKGHAKQKTILADFLGLCGCNRGDCLCGFRLRWGASEDKQGELKKGNLTGIIHTEPHYSSFYSQTCKTTILAPTICMASLRLDSNSWLPIVILVTDIPLYVT
jgi:hypothetical protein